MPLGGNLNRNNSHYSGLLEWGSVILIALNCDPSPRKGMLSDFEGHRF